ncbi:MAG: amidohydrolase [Anaerolineae bacterium]|nr:amidohydrolase [Anaerolineae bacterium]
MTPRIERLLLNGRVRTLNARRPSVTALALSAGRIVAVSEDSEALRALVTSETVVDDLEGRAVLPGFVDAHLHWQGTTEGLFTVDLHDVPSRHECAERVAQFASNSPPGEWILGYGWSQDSWADGCFPSADDLDAATTDHPVFLKARSGHAAWVNSLALRLCGVDREMSDPPGGQILRKSDGTPSGVLLEWTAMGLISSRIPPISVETLATRMLKAQEYMLRLGLTGFHDFDWRDSFLALQILHERRELNLRVVKQVNAEYLESALDLGVRQGFGDEWIRIGNLKIFADGALGPRTASMIAPYDGEPGNFGIVVTDKEEILELVGKASAAGFASSVHAIGDRAVHDLLDVYEQVRRQEAVSGVVRSLRRHRIEHVQLIHPDDVSRLAELDVIASMQPIHATSDYPFADRYWGARCAWAYNPRLQLDRGVVVAFGSDSPVEHPSPLLGIHAAVTRQRRDGSPGPEGWYPAARLSVDEAVRGYTLGPAYAAGLEDRQGKLELGFWADLVVLDRDLYAVPPEEIPALQIVGTMVGGDWKYREF